MFFLFFDVMQQITPSCHSCQVSLFSINPIKNPINQDQKKILFLYIMLLSKIVVYIILSCNYCCCCCCCCCFHAACFVCFGFFFNYVSLKSIPSYMQVFLFVPAKENKH
jgi:hypothetical protein